ncbi:MAG: 3-phosphoshikimate 1-carboxyvinyltransferase [Acidimicrobiales bacterium]
MSADPPGAASPEAGSSSSSITLSPVGPVTGRVAAPSSKSVSNRLLVLACLAEGSSRLSGLLASDDTAVMAAGLRALGAEIGDLGSDLGGGTSDGGVTVRGTGGALQAPEGVVGVGLSGTTLRFLACVALLAPGTVTLDGDPPLRRRPIGPLIGVLERLGATVGSDRGRPPVAITPAGLPGGRIEVDAATSSQFASGILLVAPFAAETMVVEVSNLGAAGYVELTVAAMRRWGAEVSCEGTRYEVTAGCHYIARQDAAEYDASAAAHLFALAMASGGSITVSNAVGTVQPDSHIVAVLAAMGGSVASGPDGVTVTGPSRLQGVDVDVSTMPDQLPTLAVLGALASGRTRLTGVSVARGHETDRVAAIATELGALGASVEAEPDALVVHGGRSLHGGAVRTYHDHRMAMALSCLAAVVPGITILDPGCVSKTYPGYWSDLAGLGLRPAGG